MTTFHVQPGVQSALRIYSPRLGYTIQFVDGRYETSDPDEIRVLRRNRSCYDSDDLDMDLAAVPTEGADPAVVNVELDRLRREHDEDDFGPDDD